MRLSRASAYAVFAVIHIAENATASPVSCKDISDACGIPGSHLLKILQQLVRSRVLISERGPGGGFGLARSASEINLLDIVEALDGPMDVGLEIQREIPGKEKARTSLESICREVSEFDRSLLRQSAIAHLTSFEPAMPVCSAKRVEVLS